MKIVPLGELIQSAPVHRAGAGDYPVLSMTMRDGLVDQSEKFKKRVASRNTANYKIVARNQLVIGFPIDEAPIDFQNKYQKAIVSPAYGIWDVTEPSKTDRRYLQKFLRSPRAVAYYLGKLRGSTARRRSLPKATFLELPVPLPPLCEQQRIVDILDRADAVHKNLRKNLRLLQELERSIFQSMFGHLKPNAELADVSVIQGGLQVSQKRQDYPITIPYLRVANVYRGKLQLAEVKKLQVTQREIDRTALKAGDLLFVEGHANPLEIGRGAVWDGSIQNCTHQNHLIRARLEDKRISPKFAEAWFNSESGAYHFRRLGNTTSGLNTINAADVKSAPLIIPDPLEQQKFDVRMTNIKYQINQREKTLKHCNKLFAALESSAFRGEL